MYRTCGSSRVFSTSESHASVMHHNGASTINLNCTCGISAVFGMVGVVGTCLCVTKRTVTTLSMNWACRVPSLLNKNIDLLVLGISNRLNHWDLPLRQDKNVDNLVDEHCRCTTTGMSKSQPACFTLWCLVRKRMPHHSVGELKLSPISVWVFAGMRKTVDVETLFELA